MLETLELDYNTSREKMIIPEYGRHIQKLIDHAVNIESKENNLREANEKLDQANSKILEHQ